jgi:hypothetical protein
VRRYYRQSNTSAQGGIDAAKGSGCGRDRPAESLNREPSCSGPQRNASGDSDSGDAVVEWTLGQTCTVAHREFCTGLIFRGNLPRFSTFWVKAEKVEAPNVGGILRRFRDMSRRASHPPGTLFAGRICRGYRFPAPQRCVWVSHYRVNFSALSTYPSIPSMPVPIRLRLGSPGFRSHS